MKNFKHKISFSSTIRTVIDEKVSKSLSVASIQNLQQIIDKDAFSEGKQDLLPVAGNLCVVNFMNENGVALPEKVAFAFHKSLEDKFLDIEHRRNVLVGHIKNTAFSTFDLAYKTGFGSAILTEEQAKELKGKPFNLAISGYVYRVLSEDLINEIIASSDPSDKKYLSISLSWELAYDTSDIAIGPRELVDAKIVSDPIEKEKYQGYLVANKGSGKLDADNFVYEVITGEVIFLGAGLTFNPASAVKGVTALLEKNTDLANKNNINTSETLDNSEVNVRLAEINNILSNNSSQNEKITVKESINMKSFASVQEIKEAKPEDFKELSLASVNKAIEAEIARVSEEYANKVELKEKEAKAAKEQAEEAVKKVTELTDKINKLQESQAKVEADAKFQTRMAHLDENYNLDSDQKVAIASAINGLADDKFDGWMKNFEVLAKSMKKTKKEEKEEKKESTASKEEATKILDGTEKPKTDVANTTIGNIDPLAEMKEAFSLKDNNISFSK